MNIEEAINTALEYENKVYDVYSDNADKLQSATAKKIFAVLAKEEQDHVDYLKNKLAEWRQSGKVTVSSIDTAVPDMKSLKESVKKLEKTSAKEDLDDEIKIFKKALDLEMETSNFYKNLVAGLSSENQKLFKRFIEIEEGHVMIMRAEIDNAKKSGFWFDFMEFDLEAG